MGNFPLKALGSRRIPGKWVRQGGLGGIKASGNWVSGTSSWWRGLQEVLWIKVWTRCWGYRLSLSFFSVTAFNSTCFFSRPACHSGVSLVKWQCLDWFEPHIPISYVNIKIYTGPQGCWSFRLRSDRPPSLPLLFLMSEPQLLAVKVLMEDIKTGWRLWPPTRVIILG